MSSLDLQTPRLILRASELALARPIAEYFLRNRAFLAPFEPVRNDAFFLPEAQEKDLALDVAERGRGMCYRYWIVTKSDPARIIGSVSIANVVRGAFQSCTMGYRLDKDELRRGYMTEAAGALVRYAFDELKLHRIEANIMPRNQASLGVVRNLGFHEEGLAKQYLKINGVWEDHIHMVILNPEV